MDARINLLFQIFFAIVVHEPVAAVNVPAFNLFALEISILI